MQSESTRILRTQKQPFLTRDPRKRDCSTENKKSGRRLPRFKTVLIYLTDNLPQVNFHVNGKMGGEMGGSLSDLTTNRAQAGLTRSKAALNDAELRYSIRSASMGEIDAARFAGMMAAKNEQIASAPAATVSASGSQEETPYSWAEIKRPAPTASGNPNINPINTRLNAPRSTS